MNEHNHPKITYSFRVNLGLLMIRIMLAAVFMFHGSQKLFGLFGGSGIEKFSGFLESINVPYPTVSAYLAACSEFFGGFLLLLGVATPIAALFLVTTMLVACFKVHGGAFSAQHGGMEYPLTLAIVTAGVGLIGPGRFAVCWKYYVKKKSTTRPEAPPPEDKPETQSS